MYIKLPGWFRVPTPVGEYNPDWAIVAERGGDGDGALLYLIAETKSTHSLNLLRPDERRKIQCGRHFQDTLRTMYRVMTTAADLDREAASGGV